MQEQPRKKKSNFNWFGIVVFLLFAVGPSAWRFLNSVFSGAGLALPSGISWPVLAIGAIVLAVLASVVIQGVQRAQSRSETRLPTTMSPQSRPQMLPPTPMSQRPTPSNNMPMPPFGGELGPLFPNFPPPNATIPTLPSRAPQMPRPPGFEPIISGKALLAACGLVGLFGLAYLLAAAVLP